MKGVKRKVDLVVISDVHLGTYGCHAKELLRYLKSIQPKKLILNGDIIDIWQFSKHYWPKSHMQVVQQIMQMVNEGVEVTYITGNHDEMLRRFHNVELGKFKLTNKLVLELDGQRTWFFHGDVFDFTMQTSKWAAKTAGLIYDRLIVANRFINFVAKRLGRGPYSLSKRVKDNVKSAIKFIDDFEQSAANAAIANGFKQVVCGHIHQPQDRLISNKRGSVRYLNSGDWIENLTALEYHQKEWTLYRYMDDHFVKELKIEDNQPADNPLLYEFLQRDILNFSAVN